MMNRLARAIVAAVAIVVVLVVVPAVLIVAAGWPLPTTMPDWNGVYWSARQGHVPAEFVIKVLACVVWLAWAQIAWALLWELVVNIPRSLRGRAERPTPLTAAPASRFARRLVTTAMILTAIASTPATTVAAPELSSLRSAPFEPNQNGSTATLVVGTERVREAPVQSRSAWRVIAGDTLWDIAEQCLGDGSRVDEIVAYNPYLVASRPLRAGQLIELPEGVSVPAERVATDWSAAVTSSPAARPENAWIDAPTAQAADPVDRFDGGVPPVGSESPSRGMSDADVPERLPRGTSPSPDSEDGSDPNEYIVQPGDSIYAIADRMAGPDREAVVDYVDRILELNLDREMNDGRRFTDAGFIDVGWVLVLPDAAIGDTHTARGAGSPTVEVVDEGETLWSIADDRLGAGERWPEIYDVNEGRTFDDGRTLSDPDLIHAGWELDLPSGSAARDGDDARDDRVAAEADAPSDVDGPAGAEAGAVSDDQGDRPRAEATSDGGGGRPDAEAGDPPDGATTSGLDEVAPRPENVWIDDGTSDASTSSVAAGASSRADEAAEGDATETAGTVELDAAHGSADDDMSADAAELSADPELLTFERAAMLSAGVLTLLAVRRRSRMRGASPNSRLPAPAPRAVATERALRSIGAGDRFARVDIAIRNAAPSLVDHDCRVEAVAISADGDVELYASAPVHLSSPWEPAADGEPVRWHLGAGTPIELLVDGARQVGAPCPTLVQLGRDVDGRDVYIDLEALEVIEVDGPDDQSDAIVAAVASTLATSPLAEVTTLVGVGVPDAAFLGHRLHRGAHDANAAFDETAEAIGSTATVDRSTFELRARVTSGETWEPAVVLAGSAVGTISPPRRRTGLAVVSASPIHGPSSRLVPDGDAWLLLPIGLRLEPVGLRHADVEAIASLTTVPEPLPVTDESRCAAVDAVRADDPDITLVGAYDDDSGDGSDDDVDHDSRRGDVNTPATSSDDPVPVDVEPLPYELVVRLLGQISVESADGRAVEFERSKTKELVAWLATHRDRSTRSNARAALWEMDVRDATFANVVSEARRGLARLVAPPEGDEWVGRTMTDALPLHPRVVTDLDLIEHALRVARLQPPSLAIETLTPAVDLVAGVPFEGTSYLWPDAEGITSDLVLRAITVTNALAAHCLSVGDIEGVFDATARGLQVIPAHEDMIAVRMRAYAHVGDRAGVRHEWETYERAIVSDPWSDGEPSDRMRQLRQELLS